MGQFKLSLNTGDKKIEGSIAGVIEHDDAMGFIKEYKRLVNSVKASDYDFNLDCTKVSLAAANMVDVLQGCFEMYKEDGFKMVRFILPEENHVIIKMQFSRLARKAGLLNHDFIIK